MGNSFTPPRETINDCLPDEMLREIFSRLPTLAARRAALRTCRRWRAVYGQLRQDKALYAQHLDMQYYWFARATFLYSKPMHGPVWKNIVIPNKLRLTIQTYKTFVSCARDGTRLMPWCFIAPCVFAREPPFYGQLVVFHDGEFIIEFALKEGPETWKALENAWYCRGVLTFHWRLSFDREIIQVRWSNPSNLVRHLMSTVADVLAVALAGTNEAPRIAQWRHWATHYPFGLVEALHAWPPFMDLKA
jgi:hypothetical protein